MHSGFLPLAIVQAATWISTNSAGIRIFLESFQSQLSQLNHLEPYDSVDHNTLNHATRNPHGKHLLTSLMRLLSAPAEGKLASEGLMEENIEASSTIGSSTMVKSVFDHATLSEITGMTPYSDPHPVVSSFNGQHSAASQTKTGELRSDHGEQDSETYSDAGSITDYEDVYANILQNELLQDLDPAEMIKVEPLLSQLVEEFAIRIGHEGESQDNQNMMYIAHKYRR